MNAHYVRGGVPVTTTAELIAAGDAACLGADDLVFFPAGRDPVLALPAKRICRTCPVIKVCLEYALTHDVYGIWGGTTPDERDQLRRQHQIRAELLDPLELYTRRQRPEQEATA